jgi:hypothetical protein
MEATASPSKEGSSMGVGKGEGRFEGETLTDARSSSVILQCMHGAAASYLKRVTSTDSWGGSITFFRGDFNGRLERQQYI